MGHSQVQGHAASTTCYSPDVLRVFRLICDIESSHNKACRLKIQSIT